MDKHLYLNGPQLKAELRRCLNCKTQPCMKACPVNCNARDFIQAALEEHWDEAVAHIVINNPMGQTCGLICPDKFCMKACTRTQIDFPINIPRVQATILNLHRKHDETPRAIESNGHHVAILGAGPAGMAATAKLVAAGFHLTIFEARHEIGGALNMIPQARLPHEIIERDWSFIFDERFVTLRLNTRITRPEALLASGTPPFDAIIVATGEPNCMALHIPGEELSVSYMDYLYHPERYQTDGYVAVIGGGNVAADCALTAQRQGARSVEMFIRRRIADMRVSKPEYLELLNHEINLNAMMSPEKIERRAHKLALAVHRNFFDGNAWTPLPGSTIELPYFDLIIRAIGSRADTNSTNDPRIVYAGDCKTGGSTIVEAIASGRLAAEQVIDFLHPHV